MMSGECQSGQPTCAAVAAPCCESSRVVLLSSNEAKRGHRSAQTTREQLLNPIPYDGKQVYRHQTSQLAVRPGATPSLHPNKFARQRRRCPSGCRFDQPLRSSAGPGRSRRVGPSEQSGRRGSLESAEVYTSSKDPSTAARLWELTEEVPGPPYSIRWRVLARSTAE